jgi:arsenical pump membrane protein
MYSPEVTHGLTWATAAVAIAGILVRPWGVPEAIWATGGALLLVLGALLPAAQAWHAVQSGAEVYGFLSGMMLLAELAREHGLFEWLAALAARQARGSARRLFTLVYALGVLVTLLLSNDATAVVLTPAVYAITQAAGVTPLPYLYVCAFIANAASFTLPIANPANLVVFGNHLPPLGQWVARFAWPSLAAIVLTYALLRITQRQALREPITHRTVLPPLSGAGRIAAAGIIATALLLLALSASGHRLGLATALAGLLTMFGTQLAARRSAWPVLRQVSWGVLPLVAGLFVLVAGIDQTGAIHNLSQLLSGHLAHSSLRSLWIVGIGIALACNLANNLPIALIVATTLGTLPQAPSALSNAMLIGVDLGPNLSVTGSLATILWLIALRREGQSVGALQFLGLGVRVMTPALVACLVIVWLQQL